MPTAAQQEAERRKLLGWIVSLAIHTALLLVIYFFMKITPPNPPWGDLGVQVNFGFDEAGFGDVSTMETAGTERDNQLTANADPAPAAPTDPAPSDEQVTTTTAESPVEVPEKPATKPAERSTLPVTKPTPNATPAKTPETGKGTGGSSGGGGGANDGNVKGAVGNQGKPDGNPDALNYNGNGGSGGSLQLTGWKWDEPPTPDDESDATGKIVFQVKVDAEGELVGIAVLERTVDPRIVEKYKKAVEKLTFTKTKDNQNPAEVSVGKIIFVLKGN